MNKKIGIAISAICLFASTHASATTYSLPSSNESLIGTVQNNYIGYNETAVNIAKQYDVGYNAIADANPHIDLSKGFPSGAPLQIPTQHLLPNQTRQGIVINLPEMRLYYFVNGEVRTYPVGIGKIGKTIPITNTAITRKTKNPVWIPPQDIREFNLEQGIVLPRIMPAGPDNPLGQYAIYMRVPTYLIHSSPFTESIGKRASFGCIRMFESDIEDFFPLVQSGIPVTIINSPVKVGWEDNRLFIEAHHPLEEHSNEFDASLPGMIHMISNYSSNRDMLIDWQMVSYIAEDRDGIPHEIGVQMR